MKWSLVLHNEDESFHLRIERGALNVKAGRLHEEGRPLAECVVDLLPCFAVGVVNSGLEWRHGITTLLELSQGSATDAFRRTGSLL